MTNPFFGRCRKLAAAQLIGCVLCFALSANAQSKDEAAKKLAQDAIFTDYLALNLEGAEEKLLKAIKTCGDEGCSPPVKASILRDLGVVYVAGMQRVEDGTARFVEALATDPNVTLDKDLSTPEVEAAFEDARKQLGMAAAEPKESGEEPPTPTPVEGDGLRHTPPPEQAVLTPVPIFVQAGADLKVNIVRVRFRGYGAELWKTLQLSKHKDGYGGLIPCLDVGSTTGSLSYYIEAVDADNKVIASLGSEDEPLTVAIKHELDGDPPYLPGKPPPAQCRDSSDCPPEFPGCAGGGEFDDGDMDAEPEEAEYRRHRISLSGQMEALLFQSAEGICQTERPDDLSCFYGDGTFRDAADPPAGFGQPPDPGGKVEGGFQLATARVLLGYDFALSPNFSLGARAGWAFRGGPKGGGSDAREFLPIHGEARINYWFGGDPLGDAKVAPYVTLGGGVGQVDAKVIAAIIEPPESSTPGTVSDVEVWKKTGTAFVALGGGANFMFSKQAGMLVEVRALQMLPVSGTAIAASTGVVTAF